MIDNPLCLSLDIGTSSSRAMLWNADGNEEAGVKAQVKYHFTTTPDGGVEMEADEFLDHVFQCLDEAISQAGDRASAIRAVGISTYWHSMLGLDESGKPITPIYSWADARPGEAARALRKEWDETEVHARTGCMIHPSYYPAKLKWLRESSPDIYKKVARWASPGEYLMGELFGRKAQGLSLSMASGTGLLNQETCDWDAETLEKLQLTPELFAPIVDLKNPSHGLASKYSTRWNALKEVPFFPAVGDGACGNVGSGCITPERMAINLGTSGAIRVMWSEDFVSAKTANSKNSENSKSSKGDEIQPPLGLWQYRADRKRPVIGGAFSDGGDVFAWMSRTLQLPTGDELEAKIAEMEPGAHGLTFLPFLGGERSIGWNPAARASLTGLCLDSQPIEIMRCALESVALRFTLAANLLREVFPDAKEIVASGGALTKSPAWSQIFADALGQPVTLAEEAEASSRGAALLAMEAAGILESLEKSGAKMGKTYEPDGANHKQYLAMLEKQQDNYRRLTEEQ